MSLTQEEEKRFEELGKMAFNFARNNQCDDLEVMIKAGLNVNLKTHKGDSLLMLAAYHNALETAQMLLENGARVDEKNDRGQTPLAGVCFKGYLPMCKLLVENGANIDENNGLGMTPYSFAIMFRRKEIAEFLLQHSKKSLFKRGALKVLKLFNA
ncbi:ankyrin repeat domain-containing protein [Helicobacter sp.]|uniref:ankyrin repeat domain-containing protein n=1 Tax=Helicobacter sp. TaxID=218 RepID=UPI0025BD983F|nr:ankyrin repeat domain-containing protein [Helicobacter sp.]MCI5968279.1 ankyrin repeat domain-containing protein [Helicobacter sp.]MDY2585371.1 ankyrin repeat domain-containing protein [Helicobacter sp.]